MEDFEKIFELTLEAAREEKRGNPIGFNGYGFFFDDGDGKPPLNGSYATIHLSSKLIHVGEGHESSIIEMGKCGIFKLYLYEKPHFLYYLGALKALLPDMRIGGDEDLFSIWVYVITPALESFPLTFYYGASGLSIGGWSSEDYWEAFSEEFLKHVNATPFGFSDEKIKALRFALEGALDTLTRTQVIKDYHGVYQHDFGYDLMGVKLGQAFSIPLGYECDEDEISILFDDIDLYIDNRK